MKHLAITAIKLYQTTRFLRLPACRFYPSCSAYAEKAIEQHGLLVGLLLFAWRILRCHPLCPGGVDEVPAELRFIGGCKRRRCGQLREQVPLIGVRRKTKASGGEEFRGGIRRGSVLSGCKRRRCGQLREQVPLIGVRERMKASGGEEFRGGIRRGSVLSGCKRRRCGQLKQQVPLIGGAYIWT